MARIYIDDTEIETAVLIREALLRDGHEIEMISSAREMESRLRDDGEAIALILTGPPDGRASRRLKALIGSKVPRPPVIGLMNPAESGSRAEIAERWDLDDCLPVPVEPPEVQVVLGHRLELYDLQVETGIIGSTEAIHEVLERVSLIAPVASTVLITGESGTGKELVARAIHRLSPRRGGPFIAMNCAAIPESLLESELFGHEKGSFTGATSRRKGMFELAHGGTLLLDEIAEMPLPLQTRLLRVLESHRFMRVGGDSEIEVNVRVTAATNRDLRVAVARGEFRRDLYYRLNVLHVDLPPLRARKRDLPALVGRFIQEFSLAHDREFKGLAKEAMDILLAYDWPGNVRELRNLIESMVVLAPGSVIRAEDIPPEIRSGTGRSLLPMRSVTAMPQSFPGGTEGTGEGQVPQMEFIFRTLVEMKMDLEDLRSEFERFRLDHPELLGESPKERERGQAIEIAPLDAEESAAAAESTEEMEPPAEEPAEMAAGATIRLDPEMTMSDLEREAILLTLADVNGNRRKTAERLKIGERTLYRKLREYGIDR